MYFAVIEASPKHGTDAFNRYEGAHIACWINTAELAAGRKQAISLVGRSGWFVKAVKEERILSAEDCPRREGGMQYFNQALVDGEVCVIYTFPHADSQNS
jgi:hypothetical protein